MPIKFLVFIRIISFVGLQLCFYYIEESSVGDLYLFIGLRMSRGREVVFDPEI